MSGGNLTKEQKIEKVGQTLHETEAAQLDKALRALGYVNEVEPNDWTPRMQYPGASKLLYLAANADTATIKARQQAAMGDANAKLAAFVSYVTERTERLAAQLKAIEDDPEIKGSAKKIQSIKAKRADEQKHKTVTEEMQKAVDEARAVTYTNKPIPSKILSFLEHSGGTLVKEQVQALSDWMLKLGQFDKYVERVKSSPYSANLQLDPYYVTTPQYRTNAIVPALEHRQVALFLQNASPEKKVDLMHQVVTEYAFGNYMIARYTTLAAMALRFNQFVELTSSKLKIGGRVPITAPTGLECVEMALLVKDIPQLKALFDQRVSVGNIDFGRADHFKLLINAVKMGMMSHFLEALADHNRLEGSDGPVDLNSTVGAQFVGFALAAKNKKQLSDLFSLKVTNGTMDLIDNCFLLEEAVLNGMLSPFLSALVEHKRFDETEGKPVLNLGLQLLDDSLLVERMEPGEEYKNVVYSLSIKKQLYASFTQEHAPKVTGWFEKHFPEKTPGCSAETPELYYSIKFCNQKNGKEVIATHQSLDDGTIVDVSYKVGEVQSTIDSFYSEQLSAEDWFVCLRTSIDKEAADSVTFANINPGDMLELLCAGLEGLFAAA